MRRARAGSCTRRQSHSRCALRSQTGARPAAPGRKSTSPHPDRDRTSGGPVAHIQAPAGARRTRRAGRRAGRPRSAAGSPRRPQGTGEPAFGRLRRADRAPAPPAAAPPPRHTRGGAEQERSPAASRAGAGQRRHQSLPATRSLCRQPCLRIAHTTPMPSASASAPPPGRRETGRRRVPASHELGVDGGHERGRAPPLDQVPDRGHGARMSRQSTRTPRMRTPTKSISSAGAKPARWSRLIYHVCTWNGPPVRRLRTFVLTCCAEADGARIVDATAAADADVIPLSGRPVRAGRGQRTVTAIADLGHLFEPRRVWAGGVVQAETGRSASAVRRSTTSWRRRRRCGSGSSATCACAARRHQPCSRPHRASGRPQRDRLDGLHRELALPARYFLFTGPGAGARTSTCWRAPGSPRRRAGT